MNAIVRHALYVDQMLVTDPFQSEMHYSDVNGVLRFPEKWIEHLANKALAICALEDWINSEIVVLIPNFAYYHPDEMRSAADEWIRRGVVISEKTLEYRKEVTVIQWLVTEAPALRKGFLEFLTEGGVIKASEHQKFLELVDEYERKNPIRFVIPPEYLERISPQGDTYSKIMGTSTGVPLPLATSVAQSSGSFLLFESSQLLDSLNANSGGRSTPNQQQQKLAIAFSKLEFPFLHNVPLEKTLALRKKGYFRSFRVYLREVWDDLSSGVTPSDFEDERQRFSDRLHVEYYNLKKEVAELESELRTVVVERGLATAASILVGGTVSWVVGSIGVLASLSQGAQAIQRTQRDLSHLRRKPIAILLAL
ncbi:MAG: hypothetical protein K1X67_05825 [Fimbriimonadaceae bacterium]|nr:hypothetical protein [Fimbriimonadaceae bacterium]